MSKRQRRDHQPVVGETRQGITLCKECGERIRQIRDRTYDRRRPVAKRVQERTYWRHWRRT